MKVIQLDENIFYNLELCKSFNFIDNIVIESDPVSKNFPHRILLTFVGKEYTSTIILYYSQIEYREMAAKELLDFINSNDSIRYIKNFY
ncbi:MAG: hypothetical protein IAE93_05935 [Ignavibacteria bacterium]|mgnify:CR=1 FL=1|nr:hypothetical protein [Ignavibacteria bacterium]